jgi:hypothetical protein
MLSFFGAPCTSKSYTAHTYSQLSEVLNNEEFQKNKEIQLLEVFMDKFDSPWALTEQVNIMQEKSGRQLREWDEAVGRKRRVLDGRLSESRWRLEGSESLEVAERSKERRGVENGFH